MLKLAAAFMLVWAIAVVLAFLSYKVEVLLKRRTYWEFLLAASTLALFEPVLRIAQLHAETRLEWGFISSMAFLLSALLGFAGVFLLKKAISAGERVSQ